MEDDDYIDLTQSLKETIINKGELKMLCINGLDTTVDLSRVAQTIYDTNQFSFVCRYLGGKCYPSSGKKLSKTEAQVLSNVGFSIVSIYSGGNNFGNTICGTQTEEQGKKDAQDTVNLALSVGQPANTAIYLDIEANQNGTGWIDYVNSWSSIVNDNNFTAGIYSSPAQCTTLNNQGSNVNLYWVAAWKYREIQTDPVPCPSDILSFAQMWQYSSAYGPNTSRIGNTNIDVNSAIDTTGMWTL